MHKKALPRTRLSSLYLFDATCRYAADIVRKKGSGYDHGEVKPPAESMAKQGSKQALTESASTFLQSASDIVEEIVLNTMEAVREDQQVGRNRIYVNNCLDCLRLKYPFPLPSRHSLRS